MTTDLRDALRAADPARSAAARSDEELRSAARRLIADVCAEPAAEPAAASASGACAEGRHGRAGRGTAGAFLTRRRLLVALPAAVALAAVAVAVPVLGSRPTVSAEAATLLNRAADAITTTDPPARPDQWWRIRTSGHRLLLAETDKGEQTYLQRQARVEYASADGSRRSVFYDEPQSVLRWLSEPSPQPEAPSTRGVWFGDEAPASRPGDWWSPNPAFLAELPRDPALLRARLYADTRDSGQSRDGEVLVTAADFLRSGLVPADLRAAIFRVLATVPGVEVADRGADVMGRRGVAFAYLENADGERQELVIDVTTGDLIGERYLDTEGHGLVPEGTVTTEVAITRDLVDRVPTDVLTAAARAEDASPRIRGMYCDTDGRCVTSE